MAGYEKIFTSNLSRRHDLVKAKIVALGISMGDLATEAGLSASALSDLVRGTRNNLAAQQLIVRALRDLTGCKAVTRKYLFGADRKGRAA